MLRPLNESRAVQAAFTVDVLALRHPSNGTVMTVRYAELAPDRSKNFWR
jgi:hypothetical protein